MTDSAADIAVTAEQAACEARNMRSNSAEKVSTEFQMFSGELPTLVLMAAPQQGKTSAAADFIAWLAGRRAASRK